MEYPNCKKSLNFLKESSPFDYVEYIDLDLLIYTLVSTKERLT